MRSLSAAQESAQLLGGADVVKEIMSSLIDGTVFKANDLIHFINLTPYEGTVEYTMRIPRDPNGFDQ